MKLLFLGGYNNYFNRIVKYHGSVADYETAVAKHRTKTAEFNPNDDVETTLILDWMDSAGTPPSLNVTPFKPDYLVVYEETVVENVTTKTIKSRWFVKETIRTREGQYRVLLRRDVVVDNLSHILQSKAYIQKGNILDSNNPLLFNKENFTCNQIKTREIPLYDQSGCPWLVLYLKKGVLNPDSAETLTIKNDNSDTPALEINTTIDNWDYFRYSTQGTDDFAVVRTPFALETYAKNFETQGDMTTGKCIMRSDGSYEGRYVFSTTSSLTANNKRASVAATLLKAAYDDDGYDDIMELGLNAFDIHTDSEYNDLYNMQGIIKDSAGKYYEIRLTDVGGESLFYGFVNSSTHSSLFAKMSAMWNAAMQQTQVANNNSFLLEAHNLKKYRIVITERPDLDCSATKGEIKKTTKSSLFDIVAVPYGNIDLVEQTDIEVPVPSFNTEKAKMVMDQLVLLLGGSTNILDYQIVPYCPLSKYVKDYTIGFDKKKYIDIDDVKLFWDFKENSDTVARVYLIEEVSFTFNIELDRFVNPYIDDLPIYNYKLVNDTVMCRICSPNYSGIYEYNPARNGDLYKGKVAFNVDVTLKPFMPYIHLNPVFSGLYGQDFNDARGLICGGDFSLGMVDSAWISYQYTNKNYQKMFDRDIQSLDLKQSIQTMEAAFGAVTGTVSGASAGAVTGAKFGGGYGAIAGAVIGAGAGIVGGVLDMNNLGNMQKDQRDLAIDKFKMSLGNIKALPLSVTKTDALTFNNKLVPFIEVYECTEEEKKAYVEKIKFEGMTVGIVDTLENYSSVIYNDASIPCFVKAQIIRCTGLLDDTHMLNEINLELEKGVYFSV